MAGSRRVAGSMLAPTRGLSKLLAKGRGRTRAAAALQVPLDMKLEGLGATHEQLLDYSAFPPMRRHHESVALEQLQVRHPILLQSPLTTPLPCLAPVCAWASSIARCTRYQGVLKPALCTMQAV